MGLEVWIWQKGLKESRVTPRGLMWADRSKAVYLLRTEGFFHHFLHLPAIPPLFLTLVLLFLLAIPILSPHWLRNPLRGDEGHWWGIFHTHTHTRLIALSHVQRFE